jgi:hypothetical protein
MAAFCQLAYVPYEAAPPPPPPGAPKIEREAGRKELEASLAAGDFRLASVFNRDDTQAFLAVREGQFAVLAFRGTANLQDWRINLDAIRVPLPGVPGVTVHRGFLEAFDYCRGEIEAAVDDHVGSNLGLYITGHSLGGALAQIASAVLERDNLAACYTFGSPRVGTVGFDLQVKCPHYRVVNDWDLVPGLPWPLFRGYCHTGDPRLLTPATRDREALRHDRPFLARLSVDVAALALGLISRRSLVIDEHMIWNYRTQLEAIAAARTRNSMLTGDPITDQKPPGSR